MANSLTYQVEQDGPRHTAVKVTGIVNTADIAQTTIITPSLIGAQAIFPVPYNWRIMHIDYSIQSPLNVQLMWDAATPVPMVLLAGFGRMSFQEFGGLLNNAVAPTGNIDLLTIGWTATASAGTQDFTLVLRMEKVGPDGVGRK